MVPIRKVRIKELHVFDWTRERVKVDRVRSGDICAITLELKDLK